MQESAPAPTTGTKRKRNSPRRAPPLPSAVTVSLGTRQTQDDRHIVIRDAWESGLTADTSRWPACRFFGVFDGHKGDAASQLASHTLWSKLRPQLVSLIKEASGAMPPMSEIRAAVEEAFAATDARILEECGSSGSTATVALIIGDTICVANLGDSRTVLCRSERKFWETEDHKPALPSERARIEARGGHVATPRAEGQLNVPRLNSVLSVSRAFGDAAFKTGDGDTGGRALTAEPEITLRTVSQFDTFLLLASDGLWDVMRYRMNILLEPPCIKVKQNLR